MTNLDAITDDIRQVMEVQRNQPQFDLGAEIAKETKRALSEPAANDVAELSGYHDETMHLIRKYSFDAVVKVIINCRNQAMREGKL